MIKAVIFDCFGVLVEDSFNAFIDKHLDSDAKKQKARETDHLSTKGYITWQQNVQELARLSGLTLEQVDKELDRNSANKELFDFIRTNLKPHYKIGFLSNAADDWMEELFTSDERALFDDIILSYQFKINKPSPEIFHLAAERLALAPEECLFIDDVEAYCEGARATGMQTVRFTNSENCISTVRTVLQKASV